MLREKLMITTKPNSGSVQKGFWVYYLPWMTSGENVLYVGHHGWPVKIILGFRWSLKAEITLETTIFWQNISVSIFKFTNALKTKKKKHSISSQWEKKTEESWTLFCNGYFYREPRSNCKGEITTPNMFLPGFH